jgi:hypothetical protein
VVHSNLHSRLLSLRLPSFAGRGLPERMRSTAVAFLGLTAASALALVAIFAQLSFPLLSPAPLPDEPESRVSNGIALPEERVAQVRQVAERQSAPEPVTQAIGNSGAGEAAPSPAPEGGSGTGNSAGEGASPTPTPSPTPPASPVPSAIPPSSPPAAEPKPVPVVTPPPAPAPPPVAVPPSPPVVTPPAAASSSPPPHSNAGGNDKGNAYGHSK